MSEGTKTAVVSDTTCYLPRELIDRHQIHLVSLYVALEGKLEREADMPDYDAFYERLKMSEQAVTTSQPSVGDFMAVWEPLLADGREIVSIHLSSKISGTYQTAIQTKQQLTEEGKGGERIQVYDSETAAGGMGMVVLAAAHAAESGASADQVLEAARSCRRNSTVWFAVDTLEYLKRGDRIGGARAWIGSTLKIKPILTIEAEVVPVERVRTRARVFERLANYARQLHEAGSDAWVVQHIQDPEGAQRLIEANREIYGREPLFTSEMGPVVGAHVGPGLLGTGGAPARYYENG